MPAVGLIKAVGYASSLESMAARDARGFTYTYGFVGIKRRRRAAPEGHQLGG